MRPATSLPGIAIRALHRHHAIGGVNDSGGATGWAEIASTARALALGMAKLGVEPGDRVVTDPAPSAGTIAAEVALLANGATVVIADGGSHLSIPRDAPAPLRWSSSGLAGPWGIESVSDLLAAGNQIDAAQPDRFERLVAAVDPDSAAFEHPGDDGVATSIDHHAVLDLLRSLDRALMSVLLVDDGAPTVAVVAGRWGMTERLLGIWWPAMHGASTWLELTAGLAAAITDVRPVLVVAAGSDWSEMAHAVRRHPRLAERSRVGRGVMGNGRALAAGEVAGRRTSTMRRVAEATVLPGVRADLGLGRCRLAVALGPPSEAVRRDLLAAGMPLAVAWVPTGAPGPVTMTVPGSPDRSSGRPMPGWTITIGAGNRVEAHGPGMPNRTTHRTGRLDEEHRLWLGPQRT